MKIDKKLLHRALAEPDLLDTAQIQRLAEWAQYEHERANENARRVEFNTAPHRTRRVRWVSGIAMVGLVLLTLVGALIAYILTDKPEPNGMDRVRQQACEAHEEVSDAKARLYKMCYDD